MYPKLTSSTISSCQQESLKLYSRYFVILYQKNPNKGFSCIASKKVGNAVVRNQCKRYLRNFFTLHQESLISGYYLIICKKNMAPALLENKKYQEFEKDILKSLKKIPIHS